MPCPRDHCRRRPPCPGARSRGMAAATALTALTACSQDGTPTPVLADRPGRRPGRRPRRRCLVRGDGRAAADPVGPAPSSTAAPSPDRGRSGPRRACDRAGAARCPAEDLAAGTARIEATASPRSHPRRTRPSRGRPCPGPGATCRRRRQRAARPAPCRHGGRRRPAVPPAQGAGMTPAGAAQACLAAEHAAVYVLGVVGGQVSARRAPPWPRRSGPPTSTHRGRRDHLRATVADLGESPVAAAPAYDVDSGAGSAADLPGSPRRPRRRCAEVYAQLAANSTGRIRPGRWRRWWTRRSGCSTWADRPPLAGAARALTLRPGRSGPGATTCGISASRWTTASGSPSVCPCCSTGITECGTWMVRMPTWAAPQMSSKSRSPTKAQRRGSSTSDRLHRRPERLGETAWSTAPRRCRRRRR